MVSKLGARRVGGSRHTYVPKTSQETAYTYSIQHLTVTMGVSDSTVTQPILPLLGTGLLIFNGYYTTGTTDNSFNLRVSLSGNNIVATRVGSGSDRIIKCIVVDAKPALVTSVQAGTVSITGSNLSATAVITSVNTASSAIVWLGVSGNAALFAAGEARLDLTSATQVTAVRLAGTGNVDVGFNVIEFNPAVIQSINQLDNTIILGQTVSNSTITAIDPNNSIIFDGWQTSTNGSPAAGWSSAIIQDATTINFTRRNVGGSLQTHSVTVVEFVPEVVVARITTSQQLTLTDLRNSSTSLPLVVSKSILTKTSKAETVFANNSTDAAFLTQSNLVNIQRGVTSTGQPIIMTDTTGIQFSDFLPGEDLLLQDGDSIDTEDGESLQ